jgi:hypothetical protein
MDVDKSIIKSKKKFKNIIPSKYIFI